MSYIQYTTWSASMDITEAMMVSLLGLRAVMDMITT
jgi:hypothetical protein